MPIPKGVSLNPHGRRKGSKNEKTKEWERFRDWMMEDGLYRFRNELEKLEGKDYISAVKDLMEYFQPKLARVENTGKDGAPLEFKIVGFNYKAPDGS